MWAPQLQLKTSLEAVWVPLQRGLSHSIAPSLPLPATFPPLQVLFPAGRIIHTVWDSSAPADPPPAAAAAAAAGREERRGGESATTSGRAGPSAFPRAAAAGASPSRFPDGAAAFAAAFGFAANGSWVGHGSAAAALSSRSTSGAAPTAGDAGGGAAASPSGRQSAAAGSSDLPDGTGSPSPSGQPSGQPIHRSSSAAVALERAPARKRHVRMEPLVRLERLERRHKPPWRLPGSSGHWVRPRRSCADRRPHPHAHGRAPLLRAG